jgi:hypothetical protein
MDLSKQAYELCREQDALGLRAFLEAHPDVDVFLCKGEEWNISITGQAASHESSSACRWCLTLEWT